MNNSNFLIIDFGKCSYLSSIGIRSRLEAIFIGDNAPLESHADFSAYLEFVKSFYSAGELDETPYYAYSGRERERVMKQAALALKMRRYAFDSVQGDSNIIFYNIALLEWLLPIVCYGSASRLHKLLSMYICGILCEKLEKSLKNQLPHVS